jgi:hypothetical protein
MYFSLVLRFVDNDCIQKHTKRQEQSRDIYFIHLFANQNNKDEYIERFNQLMQMTDDFKKAQQFKSK